MSKVIGIGLLLVLVGGAGIFTIFTNGDSYQSSPEMKGYAAVFGLALMGGIIISIMGVRTHRWLR